MWIAWQLLSLGRWYPPELEVILHLVVIPSGTWPCTLSLQGQTFDYWHRIISCVWRRYCDPARGWAREGSGPPGALPTNTHCLFWTCRLFKYSPHVIYTNSKLAIYQTGADVTNGGLPPATGRLKSHSGILSVSASLIRSEIGRSIASLSETLGQSAVDRSCRNTAGH